MPGVGSGSDCFFLLDDFDCCALLDFLNDEVSSL